MHCNAVEHRCSVQDAHDMLKAWQHGSMIMMPLLGQGRVEGGGGEGGGTVYGGDI